MVVAAQQELVCEKIVRVICVDDDPIMRSLIQSRIAPWTAEFTEAEDGLSAWEMIRSGDFDIAFVDIDMPSLNGLDLLRCVRGSKQTNYLPVIVISGHDDSSSVREAFEAGASSFISKPVNWAMFEQLAAHLLRLAGAARKLKEISTGGAVQSAGRSPEEELRSQISSELRTIGRAAEDASASGDVDRMVRRLKEISQYSNALAAHIAASNAD